jgi:hypothetical protein
MHLVQRHLKDRVGARLKMSPHPFASTAVGLSIHADRSEIAPVRDRFARHFGVWRESESGERQSFDTIFGSDTTLPPPGDTLLVKRIYHPAHNIGHFRYEECAALDQALVPVGDRTPSTRRFRAANGWTSSRCSAPIASPAAWSRNATNATARG